MKYVSETWHFENVLKMSWRRLEDVSKTSWGRLEDVLKRDDQDMYIDLDQDETSWRCLLKRRISNANIFVLMKTFWRSIEDFFWRRRRKTSLRRLHQDECLLEIMKKYQKIYLNIKLHYLLWTRPIAPWWNMLHFSENVKVL